MIDLNQLKNTEVSSPSDGEVLRYRGGKLRNEELCELWEDTEVTDRLSDTYPIRQDYVNNNGTWSSSTSYKHWVVPVDKIRKVMITANEHGAYFSFFKSYEAGNTPVTEYASGYSNRVNIPSDGTLSIVVPADAKWLYIYSGISDYYKPISVLFTGTGITEHRGTSSQFVKGDGTLDNNTYLTQETNPDWNATSGAAKILNKPTNVSDFTNDVGYLTQHQTVRMVNGETLTGDGGDINLYDGFYFPNAVQDNDGNWYGAVVIGDQVWLAENLRTTHYNDGTAITKAGDSDFSNSVPYYYYKNATQLLRYGVLYNWAAIMNGASPSDAVPSGVSGIAPPGFHIPSSTEISNFLTYVSGQIRYRYANNPNKIGKALASTRYWGSNSTAGNVGNDRNSNNATGFGFMPGGRRTEADGTQYVGHYGYMWTASELSETAAGCYRIIYEGDGCRAVAQNKKTYASVRCVSDLTPLQFRDWYITTHGSMQHHIQPEVNNATLTIKENGTTIGTFTANAEEDKSIDIVVPMTASDVDALPASTKYAASLSLSVNTTNFEVTAQLKDQNGDSIGSAAIIDLPLESVVVDGFYNAQTKKVALILQNNSIVEFSVADLVSGLQSEITEQNPLSADLVTDGNVNKVFTLTLKNKLDGIEAGAQVNVQPDWNATTGPSAILHKPTIPADKVFRCQFLYVSGEGLMLDNVTPNDILNAHIAGKIVICEMVTDLYSTSTINVVMMLSDTENGPAFTGVRDCNGQTICFKMRYDTDEREWVVSTVNIGQSPVQADWNATSGLSQILNKPKHRTINGEILTGDGCDINIHDGLYFPDAAQDYEGNTYGAVVIGNQVWLSENLRTRFFPNGYWIYPGGNNESETIPYYYNNDNSNIPLKERGYLYNLAAVLHDASTSETTPSGVQGIAPDGWHIPSAAECEQLLDYVKDQKRFSEFSENGSLQYAKSLAARKRWTSTNLPGTIGYNQEDNNATGFSLVPSGTRQGGQIAREGTIGFFATCSIYNDTGNWLVYGANNADEQLGWFGSYKTDAFAVRCVSDLNPVQFLSWYIEKYGTIQHKVESMRIYRGVWGLRSNNRIEAELDVDDLNNVDLKSRYGVLLILSVTTDIPANGRLTIKGSDVVAESEIYYRGSRLTSGLIQRGDTCIVMYRYMGGTNLSFLLSNDRWGQMLSALQDTAVTIHSGSGIPDDDIGSDGDIYIMTTT